MEEPGRLQSLGSLRVGHDWATLLSLFTFMHWRRKWQPTPLFLPGESQGQRSLVGCHFGHDWSDLASAAAAAAARHWQARSQNKELSEYQRRASRLQRSLIKFRQRENLYQLESEVTQLCPTLRDPMDCSLPGSSIHGIFQARVLEWGGIAFSVIGYTPI